MNLVVHSVKIRDEIQQNEKLYMAEGRCGQKAQQFLWNGKVCVVRTVGQAASCKCHSGQRISW